MSSTISGMFSSLFQPLPPQPPRRLGPHPRGDGVIHSHGEFPITMVVLSEKNHMFFMTSEQDEKSDGCLFRGSKSQSLLAPHRMIQMLT